jgi:glycosyltransferase involved in cell wall biosynthesis
MGFIESTRDGVREQNGFEYRPFVTVIMPCLDEERYITGALKSLVDDWVLKNGEVIIMDGGSTDRTRREIEEFIENIASLWSAEKRGSALSIIHIKILENPKRLQVYGLNAGIKAARSDIIARADAHCLYPPSYVKSCVDLLLSKEKEGVANVGGVMSPIGILPVQHAIALAMKHPLGVGDARFHLGTKSGYVDTVYLGTFRKSLLDEIGPYATDSKTNEDAELNLRILRAGKKIYLDHHLRVTYFPRETFKALARQYYAYGKGRALTSWKHRRVTSWRQAVPPIFVTGLTMSLLAGVFEPRILLFPAGYALTVLIVALFSEGSSQKERSEFWIRILMAAALIIMHISWGFGFSAKLIQLFLRLRHRASSPARIL